MDVRPIEYVIATLLSLVLLGLMAHALVWYVTSGAC